jgi:hypothetical protein
VVGRNTDVPRVIVGDDLDMATSILRRVLAAVAPSAVAFATLAGAALVAAAALFAAVVALAAIGAACSSTSTPHAQLAK